MARKRGKAKAVQQAPSAEEEEEEGKKSIYERVYEEVYGRVPFPPSPLDTARNFAETVISPSVGGQSLLLAVAALIPMYLIGYTERHLYDLLGYVAVLTFPAYLCVWTVTYLASFTVVAGLLALVGNTLWWHASLRSIIISPRAMAFYALAATLYMVACKLWVGLLVGWAAGLFVPAVAYLLSVAGPVIVYLAFTSSILLIILALLLGFIFVVMAIGALVFMALSLVSAYWSRYASTITPLWRVFAVWLIVTAKQLLPPQVTYLLVAGYAVYAFQLSLDCTMTDMCFMGLG